MPRRITRRCGPRWSSTDGAAAGLCADVSALRRNVRAQSEENGAKPHSVHWRAPAGVVELADTQDLGSCVERRAGSSPAFRTKRTAPPARADSFRGGRELAPGSPPRRFRGAASGGVTAVPVGRVQVPPSARGLTRGWSQHPPSTLMSSRFWLRRLGAPRFGTSRPHPLA